MFTRSLSLSLSLVASLVASAWAASAQDNDAYHSHGAFAFIRSGERTPSLTGDSAVLTALGAQQMYELGQNLRARWIDGSGAARLGVQRIANMSTAVLDNGQISIQTRDKQYLVASAQAFMQGMYPPRAQGNSTALADSTGVLADGSVVQAPLGGYQYAAVQAFSEAAYHSIYVDGNANCPEAKRESLQYTVSDGFKETKTASQDTYELLPTSWFQGDLLDDQKEYEYALEIWDYLEYQYTHNRTVYERLTGSPEYVGVYNATRYLADEYAWKFWGNTAASNRDTAKRAMGGMTLAAAILRQFEAIVTDGLDHNSSTAGTAPITLLFGDADPMINLVSLMLMDAHNTYFRAMPPFASALVFEIYSTGDSAEFPSSEDHLWVRFHSHNGTADYHGQMFAFPMFNRGPSQTDMPWGDFKLMFSRIAMSTVVEWCTRCSAPSVFCTGVDGNTILVSDPKASGAGAKHAVSPTVAGVIGAVVGLTVAGVLAALAIVAGGVRVHVHGGASKSALGGFKGSAKLASDADVARLAQGGALPAGVVTRHERVGSWELRQKEVGDERASARESFEGMDGVTSRAVQARESV